MAAEPAYTSASNRFIFGLIADYDTVVGFLLAGIGEFIESKALRNYMIVTDETSEESIINFYRMLCDVKTVGVILVASEPYAYIQPTIVHKRSTIPLTIEIPSKNFLVDRENED